jgi:hypothetical protein
MPKSKFVDFRTVKREVIMVQVLEHYGLMSQMHRNGSLNTATVQNFVAKKEKVPLLKGG